MYFSRSDIYHFILDKTGFLYRIVYRSDYFFIDYWSFIHFFSGFCLMLSMRILRIRRSWWLLSASLILYEVLELAFIYWSVEVFRPETLPDQGTDILVGLLGGLAAKSALSWKQTWVMKVSVDWLVAFAMAFVWVSSYGYHYNRVFLNSPIINWWALTLWTIGIYSILKAHGYFRAFLVEPWALWVVWGLSLAAILAVEFFGYQVLDIREMSG
ncbi:MAG: hypothetical protein PHE55_22595, partial [Methylococcaceae bacterium]|nr:hypothetical protein [Methylococcaceae bacterium]